MAIDQLIYAGQLSSQHRCKQAWSKLVERRIRGPLDVIFCWFWNPTLFALNFYMSCCLCLFQSYSCWSL